MEKSEFFELFSEVNACIESDGSIKNSFCERSGYQRSIRSDGLTVSGVCKEFFSKNESAELLNSKFACKYEDALVSENYYFSGKDVIKANRILFDYLMGFDTHLLKWSVDFKVKKVKRVVKGESGNFFNNLIHFSIIVRLRGSELSTEIGEGNFSGISFNQYGLIRRISNLLESVKYKRSKDLVTGRELPVILSPGDGCILFHEILGHSLEADYIMRGESPFRDSLHNDLIMPEYISVSTRNESDPMFREWKVDAEGSECVKVDLVKNGRLMNFMGGSDKRGLIHPGFMRTESFAHLPQPRMFGLFVSSGRLSSEEILGSVKEGIYAAEFGEGSVNFLKDYFVFDIKNAFLIRNGEIMEPLGAVKVRGSITETLKNLAMVGDDFRFDRGISYCLKNQQLINVRVGQPTVKISKLYIQENNNL